MEIKVYRVIVELTHEATDIDRCPSWDVMTVHDNMCSSKIEAIRQAQSKFDRQPLNDYVHQVWARVYPITITDKKSIQGERIYNKFKSNN